MSSTNNTADFYPIFQFLLDLYQQVSGNCCQLLRQWSCGLISGMSVASDGTNMVSFKSHHKKKSRGVRPGDMGGCVSWTTLNTFTKRAPLASEKAIAPPPGTRNVLCQICKLRVSICIEWVLYLKLFTSFWTTLYFEYIARKLQAICVKESYYKSILYSVAVYR
jgi:hypothetical protein